MNRFAINSSIVVFLGLGICLALVWVLGDGSAPAVAAPRAERHVEVPNAPVAELHVCPSGCTYSSIQDAVDAANDGDVIKVASGVYADIHVRPRSDITTTGFITQVVYISKTVTIATGGRPAPADALRDPELDTVLRAVEGLGGEQPGL